MTKRCVCGNDEWKEIFDYVPYGMTNVPMPAGEVCTNCGSLDEPENLMGDDED